MSRLLTSEEITRQLADLAGWTFADDTIHATYTLPTFPKAIDLVVKTGEDAEDMNHHPDMDVRWRNVIFGIQTHDAGGVTQLDIELAHRIQKHVADLGGNPATA